MRVDTRHNPDQQFRDVLHIIATHPEAEPCLSLILQTAAHFTGAAGAAYNSPGLAPIVLGETTGLGVDLDGAANFHSPTIDSSSNLLICPVWAGEQLVGVMSLPVDPNYQLGDAERDFITALVDGLLIVTLRTQSQFEAEEARHLAQALLTSMTDPLLVFDDQWRLLMLNPAAEAVFQPTLGQPLSNVVHSDALVAFVEGRQDLNEWVIGEKTFVPRVQAVSEDRSLGWVLALADITQYKKLNRSQNEFVRIVSHDVRSPLTSMRGFADMLGMVGDLNERQEQFVEKVLSGVAQITALVDNIQDAGRFDPETGFYEMTRSYCDLRDMLNKIVGSYLVPAEKQELTIEVAVSDDVPIINADSNMLVRAITNLVDNAIKYTPNGGKVDVLGYVRNNSVIIGVRDSGLGISPEDQKQLFQRGVRVQRTEYKKIKGSGLGLFIVKSVALRHGGDAWIESEPGVGSVFSFSIPLKGANLVIPDDIIG